MRIFKRGTSWYIDYSAQGQRIREAVGPSKRLAKKALESRRGEIVQGRFKLQEVKSSPLLEAFAKEFLEWAKVNHRGYRDATSPRVRHLLRAFQGRRLHEITPWLIEKYKAARREHVEASTVNRDLTVFSSLLTKAVEWGHIREHPMKGGKVKRLHEPKSIERVLTDEEEERLLKASPPWLQDVIVLALDTGLRPRELVRLTWDNVDLSRRELRLTETKNGKGRRVPLTTRAHAILCSLRRTRAEEVGPFPSGPGERPWIMASAFRRARPRAGLTDFRFYDLRHTFATRLVRAGVDLITVARLLGHSDLRMVQRYAHPGEADARRAVRALEAARGTWHKVGTEAEKGLRLIAVTP